jgi:RimJ/RimL family protein N-acetyltransferase
MFRRRPSVRCHASGLHQLRTGRIVVSVGRFSDQLAGHLLNRDEEAQRWQGLTDEDLHVEMPAGIEEVDLRCVIVSASYSRMGFTGLEAATGRTIGHLTLRRNGEAFEIGGSVLRETRGQGFGTELMTAACLMAHRHFGIFDLRAGCEATNTASMRWLAKSGFTQVPGPARHTLPNGRVIDAVWWVHSDPKARRECAYVVAEPGQWKRYTSPIWADLPRQRKPN